MAITKRLVKGTALTHGELDGNFTDLDGRVTTLETADTNKSQVTNSSIGALSDVDTTGVTANSILKYNTSSSKFEISTDSTGGGGGINNLVEDTTPQLGGVLDANGQNIDMGNNNITDTKVGQWDTAYGWGDHSLAGYITSTATELVTDTSPQLGGTLDANGNDIDMGTNVITDAKVGQFITAYGWGDHSLAGYLTSAATDLVNDTSPQLGGNLDMNGFEIVTTAGGHIRLDPDTTGGVGIGNVTNPSTLLHLQQSAPIITLQRLDNTLSQGISWTGQGGTEAASIKLDGTGGTTNTLIMSAFDGSSVTERLRIMANSGAGIQVTGTLNGHTIPGGTGTLALTSDITGIADVVDDTTPQLGGTLDANGNTIDMGTNILTDTNLGQFITAYAWGDHGVAGYLTSVPAQSFASLTGKPTTLSGYGITDGYANSDVDTHLNQASAGASEVLSWDGADYAWVAQSGGGSQNLFSTIASSGQNNIVADGTTDTLYIEAGTGISITTDENTDTLTINASVNSISQLNSNVTVTDTGTDGTITFDTDGTDRWQITSGGHIIPQADATYDIGNASNKVRHFFLSDNSLKFGAAELPLNVTASRLHFNSLKLMLDVVDDTTPQLGGDLDANGKNISFGDSATPGTDDTLSFGADNDLQIYHNSSDGHSYMQLNDKRLYVKAVDSGLSGPYIIFDHDTATPSTVDFSTILMATSRDDADAVQQIGQITFGTPNVTSGSFRGSLRFNVTDSNGISDYVLLDGNSGIIDLKKAVKFNRGVHEKFATLTGATGVVAHDVQSGHVFLHTTPAANWTANFTNFSLAQEDATNIAIIINQGNTAYMPTAVQIDGVAQTIVWQGNNTPTGTDNGKNVVSFTILNDGGTYIVLGQSSSFGGV